MKLKVAFLIMALNVAILATRQAAAQNFSKIEGTVSNSAGVPVAGALVKVRNETLGLGFMVVSQAKGVYETPGLPPGSYMVQGFGGGYESGRLGPLNVAAGKPSKMDIRLNKAMKPEEPIVKLRNSDYEKTMPEGDGKRLIATRCILCHGLERIVPRHATHQAWKKTIDEMTFYLRERKVPVSEKEQAAMLAYAAEHFGPENQRSRGEIGAGDTGRNDASGVRLERVADLPKVDDPTKHLPHRFLQGAEAKYVAMEFSMKGIGNHDIVVDSKGVAWVSEEKQGSGMLGRFDPITLTYSRIQTPLGKAPERALAAIALDPQDRVWVTDDDRRNSEWLAYDSASGKFDRYEIPLATRGKGSEINTLRFHPDGSVWGTGITSGRVLRLDPATRQVRDYPVPQGTRPYGMAIGGDGLIYYVGEYGRVIVRLDPATGALTPFRAPTPNSDMRRIGTDNEGNLWAGGLDSGKLVHLDYRTGRVAEYEPPTKDSGLQDVEVDTKRNWIWFVERDADRIGRFDPKTNTFTEFPMPSAGADTRRLRVDPSNSNRVWFDGRSGWIGYIEVLP